MDDVTPRAKRLSRVEERWRNIDRFPSREGREAVENAKPEGQRDPSRRSRTQGVEPGIGFDD
jgi:hypothetical protein